MLIHDPEKLAFYVKNQRKKMKRTQCEVSDLVGLRQATVSAFEQNPEVTKLDTLFRILSATNLELHLCPRGSAPIDESSTVEW